MITNSLTSLVFLALGATLVERWLTHQDDRRYWVIERSVYSSVAGIPLHQRRTLWLLINGGRLLGSPLDKSATTATIRSLIHLHNFSEVNENDVRLNRAQVPDDFERLAALAEDRAWLEVAYELLLLTQGRTEKSVARWSSLLITSRQSASSLELLTAALSDLVELRKLILALLSGHGEPLTAVNKESLIKAWRTCYVNSCAAYGDLAQAGMSAELADWNSGMRLLQPSDREVLEKLVADRGGRQFPIGRVYTSIRTPKVAHPEATNVSGLSDSVLPHVAE